MIDVGLVQAQGHLRPLTGICTGDKCAGLAPAVRVETKRAIVEIRQEDRRCNSASRRDDSGLTMAPFLILASPVPPDLALGSAVPSNHQEA